MANGKDQIRLDLPDDHLTAKRNSVPQTRSENAKVQGRFNHAKENGSIFRKFTAGKFNRRITGSIKNFYTGRIAKPANARLRWNLLFTVLIIFFISSAFWIPCIPAVNDFALEIVVIVSIIFNVLWIVAIFNALRYTWRLRRFASHQIDLTKISNPKKIIVKHMVGLCVYKEPLDLLMETIDSLASQPNAKTKLTLVIGMEDGTPNKEESKAKIEDKYNPFFERIIVTFHPRGLAGDIPGKCSNFNYCSRTAVQKLRTDKNYPLGNGKDNVELIVTTGDCDSVFGERYFDALEEDYWKIDEKQREYTVWQSPLFYCMNLDQSPFFVRVTGLMRAFFMIGYLIPWNINTMSIFSLTLELLEKGEYTHPGYQMDDIIALIRWSLAVRRKCVIRAIPVATLSGPTSGDGYINEWYEWARQVRRWTIGAAEVFHYFAIKFFNLPANVSIVFAAKFVFYYGFLLCISSVYTLIAPIFTPIILSAVDHEIKGLVIPNQKTFTWIMLGFLGLQYVFFMFVFAINYLCQPVFPQKRRDKTGILRNIFHLIMSWPTIIMYCCVELVAFLEVTIRGKAVCSHNASRKDNLVTDRTEVV
ncbi:unnamed protein product [Auanema sp. JU1783]|nr:unnamed protein product [Auanema sp. JU1783]